MASVMKSGGEAALRRDRTTAVTINVFRERSVSRYEGTANVDDFWRFFAMTLLKTAALSAALIGAAGAGAGAAMAPVFGQNTVRAVAPQPFQVIGGSGRIGVTVSDVDPTAGKAAAGVMVEEVEEESPAAKAGLKKGDVVVEFDGERVRSVRQFTRLVSETPAGRQVAAAVMRDGQRVSVNVATRESSTSRFFDGGQWPAFENLREYAVTVPPIPARPAKPAPPARAPRATPP